MNVHLCFHGIGTCTREREPGEAGYWVDRDLFLRIVDQVAEHHGVTLSFDDGNRSDVDIVLPALQERGLTATFFPLAGRLEDPLSLAADDLHQLRNAGMTIGSHGWDHVPWRRLSPADTRREFVDSRNALEEAAGAPITTVAVPLGQYDRRALKCLRQEGYRTVFSSDRHPARERAWLSARYSVGAGDDLGSVRRILTNHAGAREMRNVISSSVKRMR